MKKVGAFQEESTDYSAMLTAAAGVEAPEPWKEEAGKLILQVNILFDKLTRYSHFSNFVQLYISPMDAVLIFQILKIWDKKSIH